MCDMGKGDVDVFGHPRTIQFVESNGLATKFYLFVNGDAKFQI